MLVGWLVGWLVIGCSCLLLLVVVGCWLLAVVVGCGWWLRLLVVVVGGCCCLVVVVWWLLLFSCWWLLMETCARTLADECHQRKRLTSLKRFVALGAKLHRFPVGCVFLALTFAERNKLGDESVEVLLQTRPHFLVGNRTRRHLSDDEHPIKRGQTKLIRTNAVWVIHILSVYRQDPNKSGGGTQLLHAPLQLSWFIQFPHLRWRLTP